SGLCVLVRREGSSYKRRSVVHFNPSKDLSMTKVPAFAQQSAKSGMAAASINRREVGPRDVAFEILYCGVCHSDIHTARGEWPGTVYPAVPGHEIVGKVTRVGAGVTKYKEGDTVG